MYQRAIIPLFWYFIGSHGYNNPGATVVMIELFDPLMVLAAVQKEKCTALYGVPTMFIA